MQIILITLIVLQVLMLIILKNNWINSTVFSGGILKNHTELFHLANRTKEKGKKIYYYSILLSILGIIIFSGINSFKKFSEFPNQCVNKEYFTKRVWKGKVIEKYIDKNNRNSLAIKIQNKDGIETIENGFLFENENNYELIEIGDSIVKIKGELIAHLYKSSNKIELKTEFNCKE